MPDRPRTRAANTLDFLEFVEASRPGVRAHLRAALPPDVAAGLLDCDPTGWHDVEQVHGPYATALVAWLGADAAADAWRRYTAVRLQARPLYSALIKGALRVFGLSLGDFVRMAPTVFQQGFRDCFEAHVTVREREGVLELALAPAFARFPAYEALVRGLCLGTIDLAQAGGATLDLRWDPAGGRAVATFRW